MSIREELMALARDGGGIVRAEDALRWAKSNPESALYEAVERRGLWDDSKAAEFGRLTLVGDIIRRVRVQIIGRDESTITVRAFVSLAPERSEEGGGFREIEAVLSSSDQRTALLEIALAELDSLRRKYDHLSELAEVFAAISKIRRRRQQPKKVAVPA